MDPSQILITGSTGIAAATAAYEAMALLTAVTLVALWAWSRRCSSSNTSNDNGNSNNNNSHARCKELRVAILHRVRQRAGRRRGHQMVGRMRTGKR